MKLGSQGTLNVPSPSIVQHLNTDGEFIDDLAPLGVAARKPPKPNLPAPSQQHDTAVTPQISAARADRRQLHLRGQQTVEPRTSLRIHTDITPELRGKPGDYTNSPLHSNNLPSMHSSNY